LSTPRAEHHGGRGHSKYNKVNVNVPQQTPTLTSRGEGDAPKRQKERSNAEASWERWRSHSALDKVSAEEKKRKKQKMSEKHP